MACVLISGFNAFDYQSYAAALQRERNGTQWDVKVVKEQVDALHRRYIESECAEYIIETASKLQIRLSDVTVTASWNTDGFWYPVRAEMVVTDQDADLTPLKRLLESELGIPPAEQIWRLVDE